MKSLTKIFATAALLVSSFTYVGAQVDTVCSAAAPVTYSVTNNTGSLYAWVVVGGTVTAGVGTNQISVNWGSVPGLYSLSVVETNSFGCIGDPVSMPVRVLGLPTALVTGNNMICQGSTSNVVVALAGLGPWNITYSDGTASTTVNGINSTPYIFSTPALSGNKTYTVTSVSDGHCASTGTGSAVVTVNAKPVTSIITRH